ncbi:ABC transporter ATP-binding protein [Opitutaceae bacterium TAV5]|nr:ABC transporter ATP-binding protein [Opitutaceae bacterium TAV5]
MTASTPLVEVRNLYRHFGAVRAVNGVSFTLGRGEVVGLIGANGAGKTTTMRILASLDLPDHGGVRIAGIDVINQPARVRSRLGWMPDHFTPYPDTTVWGYLDFFARAQGLRGHDLVKRVTEIMDFTDLTPLADRLSNKLSKGQMQRLCLGRTLLSDPEFLILDEPAAGLDPKARLEFKNLVRILRDRGKTLLISSHILSELGEMCDTLIFMDGGRVVHHGDKDSLLNRGAPPPLPGGGNAGGGAAPVNTAWDISVHGGADGVEALTQWLQVRPGWRLAETRRDGVRAEFAAPVAENGTTGGAIAAELRQLCADLPVVEFRRHERRLEEAFVDMLREGGGR